MRGFKHLVNHTVIMCYTVVHAFPLAYKGVYSRQGDTLRTSQGIPTVDSISVRPYAPFTQDGDLCATFERPKNGQDAQWSPNPRKSCFCVTAPATREAEASPRLTAKFAAERIDYLATIGRPLGLHSTTTAMLVPPFCNHGNACASLLPPLSHL